MGDLSCSNFTPQAYLPFSQSSEVSEDRSASFEWARFLPSFFMIEEAEAGSPAALLIFTYAVLRNSSGVQRTTQDLDPLHGVV